MTKTKRKRDRRKRHRGVGYYPGESGLRHIRPQNKFLQMDAILDTCKKVFSDMLANGPPDWNNLPWPPGWSMEKYMFLRNYCSDKMSKHRDGRMARIMGGQEKTQQFNKLLMELIGTFVDEDFDPQS